MSGEQFGIGEMFQTDETPAFKESGLKREDGSRVCKEEREKKKN